MNKILIFTLAVATLAGVGGGAFWLGKSQLPTGSASAAAPKPGAAQSPAAKAGPPPVMVELTRPTRLALPQTVTAVGSLRSDESTTVRPEVTGRLASIGFREGERVAKGTVLFKLEASVQRAEAEQANAALALAKTKYERSQDLSKRGFVSSQALDEAQSGLRVAQAATQLTAARLAKTEIRAPFAGVIGLRTASLGDYVKEGQDLVNLESIDLLKVDFKVPEAVLARTRAGQALELMLDAFPGKPFTGKVLAINPALDAGARSAVIRAQVGNSAQALRPGMFARVRLLLDDNADALVLPEQALLPSGDDNFVFKIVEGQARRTKVEIGQRRDGKVEIIKGVTLDDAIVSAGLQRLRDGVSVKPIEATPVATAVGGGNSVTTGTTGTSGAKP